MQRLRSWKDVEDGVLRRVVLENRSAVFKATVHKATNPAVRRLMELILCDEVRQIACRCSTNPPGEGLDAVGVRRGGRCVRPPRRSVIRLSGGAAPYRCPRTRV